MSRTKLWEWFRKISLEEVQKTYDFLGGIHFDHTQGEAFYNDKMDAIIEDGKRKFRKRRRRLIDSKSGRQISAVPDSKIGRRDFIFHARDLVA